MIKIEWLTDEHDCETCGWSCAQGAVVYIDDVETFRLIPSAYCFNSVDYTDEYVYKLIIKHLGHDVETSYDA